MKLKIDWKALLIAARKAALAGTAAILATGVQAAPLGFQAGNEITVRMKSHGRRAARGIGWESGRLARSMDGPYAAPATDGTSVFPVGAAAILAAHGRRRSRRLERPKATCDKVLNVIELPHVQLEISEVCAPRERCAPKEGSAEK